MGKPLAEKGAEEVICSPKGGRVTSEDVTPIRIRGKIVEGLREAGNFTQIPWVKNQFISKLSIDPYPGTLNLVVAPENLDEFDTLKKAEGIEIVPEDPAFCEARCYPVLIGHPLRLSSPHQREGVSERVAKRLKGAIVFPMVENYPKDKMELIAPKNIKETLKLKTGDIIEVEVIDLPG
jgi:CTP-dependent riboflavin kinase